MNLEFLDKLWEWETVGRLYSGLVGAAELTSLGQLDSLLLPAGCGVGFSPVASSACVPAAVWGQIGAEDNGNWFPLCPGSRVRKRVEIAPAWAVESLKGWKETHTGGLGAPEKGFPPTGGPYSGPQGYSSHERKAHFWPSMDCSRIIIFRVHILRNHIKGFCPNSLYPSLIFFQIGSGKLKEFSLIKILPTPTPASWASDKSIFKKLLFIY